MNRKTYHINLTDHQFDVNIEFVDPRDEPAYHMVDKDIEVVIYGGANIDTLLAIRIGMAIARREDNK